MTLLDYTAGGPDFRPTWFPGSTARGYDVSGAGTGTYDVWGSDELHGEGGDDTVYAGGGNDVVYGDAGDDDLVGGWGSDWISGGTGEDGVLGDDGRILTSRNGSDRAAQRPRHREQAGDDQHAGQRRRPCSTRPAG